MKLLNSLPRAKPRPPPEGWPGNVPPKFVPLEEMITTFDSDGSGDISLYEFMLHLKDLPALKACIEQNLDSKGKLKNYQSLESRLEYLMYCATPLEDKIAAAGGDMSILSATEMTLLEKLRPEIAELGATVGFAGLNVFRQIDVNGDGKVDKAEMYEFLKKIEPEAPPGESLADRTIDYIFKTLDLDDGGGIDEDEWVYRLELLPQLKADIEAAVNKLTGVVESPSVKSSHGESPSSEVIV